MQHPPFFRANDKWRLTAASRGAVLQGTPAAASWNSEIPDPAAHCSSGPTPSISLPLFGAPGH